MRKVAVVTGASAGLGTEFARLFARDGHDVVLVARRRERMEALAAELVAAHGITAHVVAADLADADAPGRIFAEVAGKGLEIEFLVNNAGLGSSGAFVELPMAREHEQVQVNVVALAQLCRLFLPAMVARKSGRVLNVGSTAGFQPGPFMATYYATKAFVNSLSEALHHELRGTGVTVTVSCPGPVATEFAAIAGNDVSRLFQTSKVATAQDIAQEAYAAMHAGKSMIVHGFKYKMMVQSLRLAPRAAVLAAAAKMNKRV